MTIENEQQRFRGDDTRTGLPPKQGLYDPRFEHESCGVGFVVNIKGKKSKSIVQQALTVLRTCDIAARAVAKSTRATAPAF